MTSVVFKKMMRAFGVGGPSVDTVLSNPNTRPGLALDGHVDIVGGDHEVRIEHVALGLVTRVEVEGGDGEYDATDEFHRLPVAGEFVLAAGERRSLPFSFPVPWETPVTDVYGQRLRGMTMGLRTELAVARAIDKGDLDPVSVHPLPVQEAILGALARLGFQFKNADLERGRIAGVAQTLPFYQEIEFFASPRYAATIRELEVTFVASPQAVDVVLEFDKRGGFLTGGHDAYGRYRVDHADADRADWAAVVEGWVHEAAGRYTDLLGRHGHGHGYAHGHAKSGGGVGAGAMAAGVAGGLLGGMLLGEAVDEIGDAFEGDVE